MNSLSQHILNPTCRQLCELSQSSRHISLSLKRKPNVDKVAYVEQNLGTKPTFKRRLLSLKRKSDVSNMEVEKHPDIPKVLHVTETAGGISTLEEHPNLVNEKPLASKNKIMCSDLTSTIDNKDMNAFINESRLHNKDSNLKNGLETDLNSNIIYKIPEVSGDVTNAPDITYLTENDDCVNNNMTELKKKSELENIENNLNPASETDLNSSIICQKPELSQGLNTPDINCLTEQNDDCIIFNDQQSLISISSATEIGYDIDESLDTILYEKPTFSVSFALTDCKDVNVSTKQSNIKRIQVSRVENNTNIDCEIVENLQESDVSKIRQSPPKEQVMSVSLEIRKKNLSTSEDQSKVLILNTNAIEKLSHVIVQPPSYKPFRRKIQGASKISTRNRSKSAIRRARKNGEVSEDGAKLNQTRIDVLFKNIKDLNEIRPVCKDTINSAFLNGIRNCGNEELVHDDMSRIARADTARSEGVGRISCRVSKEENVLSRSSKKSTMSQIRASNSAAPQLPSPKCKNDSASSCSPRKNLDSLHFNLPIKTKSNKTAFVPRDIPHYKIVAGTHFAVDAFCYGEIPGVKNYFLTHFHSDHYSGLKKSFNKALFCTQITADLCSLRLGVSIKYIHVVNLDETVRVDGVEVTAIDANHCPGAVMLLFTLPNGKTLLHTGDFRATPAMESHPSFWNSDIHTIYLDTTYCNPRYDFPTQDQSLEMALHILRQKKVALEKVGKKFTSVLIVCGTYTIGKEKFFLGLAKRVGCAVWACPEKDKVLQTVEKRSFSHASPQSCQLHVVPMRDLTHEKLRNYLNSLQGPFSEVVAFKPSGWENGKNTPTTKDMVTIHGIPYSEHSSFSEMIRFVNFLKPKQVVPTVDISGGVKTVQKYFPCPLVYKEDMQCQSKLTDFFNIQNRQQISAVS